MHRSAAAGAPPHPYGQIMTPQQRMSGWARPAFWIWAALGAPVMAGVWPRARSRGCSLPRFAVTSRLAAGRKASAHGWSKRLTSVAVNGRWSALVAAGAVWTAAVGSGPAALQAAARWKNH